MVRTGELWLIDELAAERSTSSNDAAWARHVPESLDTHRWRRVTVLDIAAELIWQSPDPELRGFGFRLAPAGQPPLRFRVKATTTPEETTMALTRRHALSASVGAMASGSITR